MEYHVPVLLEESVEGLDIKGGGVYVDVTFGGGGHSEKIFEQLPGGKLIAFDQDPDADENARRFQSDENRSFVFVSSNFRNLAKYLKLHHVDAADGILADLGISSHQIDEGSRGFSTRHDGPLDMRMSQAGSTSATEVINDYDEPGLIHMFSFYGDIRNARTLAAAIIDHRSGARIETTGQLREAVSAVAPKGKTEKYLAQVFQAVRIEVNGEMEVLKELLMQSVDCLKPGGRLVVISYHSLEDRLVKNFMNHGNFQGKPEKDFYGNLMRPLRPLTRKPIVPSDDEIGRNPRARSAKLRIAIKENGN